MCEIGGGGGSKFFFVKKTSPHGGGVGAGFSGEHLIFNSECSGKYSFSLFSSARSSIEDSPIIIFVFDEKDLKFVIFISFSNMNDNSLKFNLIHGKLFLGIKIHLSFFESSNERSSSGNLEVKFSFLRFSNFIVLKLKIHI